jgi:pre-mRNA cleavage complex 2 protein Pcf11
MALSPTLSSEDVASDWKEALEDLREPSEHAIFNLVTIARENMDHAQAISEVTVNHIKTVKSPQAKLNAFYVMDAIVKRVRSPYTMYFGHQLFSLYMGAYTTMDNQHRHLMDKLFETWIAPVPGSLTPEPVFDELYTKPIRNALAKWRSAIQPQQASHRLPARPPPQGGYPPNQQSGYRATPPPQNYRFPVPDNGRIPSPGPRGPLPTQYPNYPPTLQPTPTSYANFPPPTPPQPAYPYSQPPLPQTSTQTQYPGYYGTAPVQYPPAAPPTITQDQLRATLQTVMQNAAEDYKKSPLPQTANLLRTLDGIRQVLDQQRLPQDQVESINREVSRIGAAFMPKPQDNQLSPDQLIAALLGGPSQAPAITSTPIVAPPVLAISTPPMPMPNVAPAPAATSLFDQLQAAGLLHSLVPTPTPPTPTISWQSGPNLFDPASLKIKRPELVNQLYEAKPDQCRQCGRRFAATAAGKEQKAKHLDWHFHTNSRVAESSKSVINRSWYIDEGAWIAYREDKDGLPTQTDARGSKSSNAAKQDPKSRWVPIPTDPSQANTLCAICMEKFEKMWSKEADQPVWIDAVKVGPKYLHASCFEEVNKSSVRTIATPSMASVAMARTSSAQSARSTPDRVLGKRKAEDFAGGNSRRKSPRV